MIFSFLPISISFFYFLYLGGKPGPLLSYDSIVISAAFLYALLFDGVIGAFFLKNSFDPLLVTWDVRSSINILETIDSLPESILWRFLVPRVFMPPG